MILRGRDEPGNETPNYRVQLGLTPAEQAALVKAGSIAHDAVEVAKWSEYRSVVSGAQEPGAVPPGRAALAARLFHLAAQRMAALPVPAI